MDVINAMLVRPIHITGSVHEGAVVPEGRGARPEATAAWKSVSLRAVAK